MPLEDFIITVFCLIDDLMKDMTKNFPLRKRGFRPKLSDSEVLTMEVVGEFLGIDTDTGIHSYFKNHWLNFFPKIGDRSVFARQAANLWFIKQRLQERFATSLGAFSDDIHIVDDFPMPLCKLIRSSRCKRFKGLAKKGYCASKKEVFYGFFSNLMISLKGVITGITTVSANIDERVSIWDLMGKVKGLIIGDKGFIDEDLKIDLYREFGVLLETPYRSNMKQKHSKKYEYLLRKSRRLIETVISQLTERFNIQKVRARDEWHLISRISRKILSHTIAIKIANHLKIDSWIEFEKIIKS
jgi:hypothetical protein